MTSPFAPPELPAEPPYSVPHGSPQAVDWPVAPHGSVVLGDAVLPKGDHRRRNVLIVVAACLLSAIGAFAVARASTSGDTKSAATPATITTSAGSSSPVTVAPATVPPGESAGGAGGLDVISIVARIRNSVVKVSVDVSSSAGKGEGVGTGVILTAAGQILTNAHVVADATAVRVLLDGQSEPVDAKVLGMDVGNDLALLEIDGKDLPVMTLADSASVHVGQPVVAMGYALDLEGDASVTSGIVSALNRSMITDEGALDGLIQTDAAISSGNSGGPLVDAAGEMIGINTAVARGDATNAANNIGFAISTKEITKIVGQLQTAGNTDTRVEGYLGIGVEDRHDGGRGAIVAEVQAGSPADKLGLKVGDVVTHVDGAEINGQGGLIGAIRDSAPGDKVTIEYSRDGMSITGDATLVARPKS